MSRDCASVCLSVPHEAFCFDPRGPAVSWLLSSDGKGRSRFCQLRALRAFCTRGQGAVGCSDLNITCPAPAAALF